MRDGVKPSIPIAAAVLTRQRKPATILCPCCGADTGVAPYMRGKVPTDAQRALRQRMTAAGVSLKVVRRWLNLRAEGEAK